MNRNKSTQQSRREFLRASLTLPAVILLEGSGIRAAAPAQVLPATPVCGEGGDITPPQTEGPFYKPSSPKRTSLIEPGIKGTRILLQGYVRWTDCKPIDRALVDFWQADADGVYDNAGYKLRGHQFSDNSGRYSLETIIPGLYPGRTRHFHVKVQAPNRPVIITTQLYFPEEPGNKRDRIFNEKLLMAVRETSAGKVATFDFVLNIG
ncbi:MAG TPA: intradiol ring-cleavage dioxygenase [Candidatus Binatia bacterium]|nr:intradiol ring-cleavage dioxygenase [Candidatus Binatia bacterium]